MSQSLFAATGALCHAGPKRVKRSWGRTVCDVVVLLALAALAGWLLHCVRHATLPAGYGTSGTLVLRVLSMAPVTEGMVVGLLGFGSMAALWIKRRDDLTLDRWSVVETQRGDLASPAPWRWREGQATRSESDVALIVLAVANTLREVQALCRAAQSNLSVEDYGEALRCAERLQGQAIDTLLSLKEDLGLMGDPFARADGSHEKSVELLLTSVRVQRAVETVGFDEGRRAA